MKLHDHREATDYFERTKCGKRTSVLNLKSYFDIHTESPQLFSLVEGDEEEKPSYPLPLACENAEGYETFHRSVRDFKSTRDF